MRKSGLTKFGRILTAGAIASIPLHALAVEPLIPEQDNTFSPITLGDMAAYEASPDAASNDIFTDGTSPAPAEVYGPVAPAQLVEPAIAEEADLSALPYSEWETFALNRDNYLTAQSALYPAYPAGLMALAVIKEDSAMTIAQVSQGGCTLFCDEQETALIDNDELSTIRGAGSSISGETLAVAVSTAVSINNTVNGGVTGNNSISDNAFGDSSGILFAVQNTGNASNINASLVINLTLKD